MQKQEIFIKANGSMEANKDRVVCTLAMGTFIMGYSIITILRNRWVLSKTIKAIKTKGTIWGMTSTKSLVIANGTSIPMVAFSKGYWWEGRSSQKECWYTGKATRCTIMKVGLKITIWMGMARCMRSKILVSSRSRSLDSWSMMVSIIMVISMEWVCWNKVPKYTKVSLSRGSRKEVEN